MRFGIQLYGVKDELQQNPEAVIRTLGSFGYRRIEPCILFGSDADLKKEGLWHPDDLLRLLPLLDALDMDVVSAHVLFIFAAPDQTQTHTQDCTALKTAPHFH